MTSLAEDTLPSFHHLITDLGQTPRRIITDFDHKLMGKSVRNFLHEKGCILESAPPKHQHQNGLVERNWRTLVRMARSWLSSALLPSSFWFHAIKRACEIKNYLPVNLKGQITSPHELVYHHKPDMRCLFPLFSVAYIDKDEDSNTNRGNFSSLSLRVIAIGKSSRANCLEFYHPPSKQILTRAVYRLDPIIASGPLFNLPYDGGIFFNTYHNGADMHQRPTFDINQTVFMPKLNNPEQYITCKVLGVPPPESNLYTIQRYDNNNIIQLPEHKIKASNPMATPHNIIQHINNSLPQWFTINSPATIYTPDMKKPKRGTLQQHQDN